MDFQDDGHGVHLRFPIEPILVFFSSTNHHDSYDEVLNQLAFRFRRRN